MRQPAESYSDVIPRLAQLEAGGELVVKIKRLVPDGMAGVRTVDPASHPLSEHRLALGHQSAGADHVLSRGIEYA